MRLPIIGVGSRLGKFVAALRDCFSQSEAMPQQAQVTATVAEATRDAGSWRLAWTVSLALGALFGAVYLAYRSV